MLTFATPCSPVRPLLPRMRPMTAVLTACCSALAVYSGLLTLELNDSTAATARRHAVEQEQFVCLDYHDRITQDEAQVWKECAPIIFRHADEEGVE